MMDFFGPGYEAAERMGILARMLEGRLLSIMRPDLELALRERVEDGVDLQFGCAIAGIDNSDQGVRVNLSDGTALTPTCSSARTASTRRCAGWFGDESRFFRYLGFHTAAYVFDGPEIHRALDQRFVLTDSVDRQMGSYGLRDGRVAAFAVHRDPAPTLPTDTRFAILETYSSLGWCVPAALAACLPSPELYYDLVAQVEIPRWARGRVVLVGDACQAVSLLAGQGASLALAGAYVLGEQLANGESIGVALARYEQVWQPVVAKKLEVGRRGADWFLPSSTLRLWLRRIALRLAVVPGWDRYISKGLVGESNLSLDDVSEGDARMSLDQLRGVG